LKLCSLGRILSQMNPIHNLISYLSKSILTQILSSNQGGEVGDTLARTEPMTNP